jgi:hypothetical protein
MTIAYDVIAVYVALAIWTGMLVFGLSRRRWKPFVWLGILIMLSLNVRYFIEGAPGGIAFFIGIYDVFDNLGLGRDEGAPALAECAANACTVWGDRFVFHPSWGVAFYERFASGPASRVNLLYVHIFLNSVAFVLMHVQLARPGVGAGRNRHQIIGRISFGAISLGTVAAILLAAEHGSVGEYGGNMAMWGFFSMSAVVYTAAVMTVVTARRGRIDDHRIWSFRYVGAMWGAFWLFRVMLVVTGPLFRQWESVSLLLSIWLSAPLGVAIAEVVRRPGLTMRRTDTDAPTVDSVSALTAPQ